MASPNLNLRDPAIYRIRHASHHRTGDKWCIYPLYDYTHCISDALERITHSICTLEFQDHRPLYDWVIDKLADGGLLERPLPQQYEFARLNLTYVVLSKRKLIQLVEQGHVDGWDDPRMPTLVGARRRGFTPAGFRLFAERIGVSKSDSWIDMSVLEDAMRDELNASAERRVAVLDPIRLVVDNYPAGRRSRRTRRTTRRSRSSAPASGASRASCGSSATTSWRRRPKGTFRLAPGAEVRLRYAYIVRCTGVEKDASGNVTVVHCTYDPTPRAGRRAPSRARSRATSTGSPSTTRCRPRCGSTTGCSACRSRARGCRTASATRPSRRRRTRSRSPATTKPRMARARLPRRPQSDSKRVIRAYVEPSLAEAPAEARSSSSATATSSPTSPTTRRAARSTNAR
jgi:glutamyl/glutaminyl-tRNA synthetase